MYSCDIYVVVCSVIYRSFETLLTLSKIGYISNSIRHVTSVSYEVCVQGTSFMTCNVHRTNIFGLEHSFVSGLPTFDYCQLNWLWPTYHLLLKMHGFFMEGRYFLAQGKKPVVCRTTHIAASPGQYVAVSCPQGWLCYIYRIYTVLWMGIRPVWLWLTRLKVTV